MGNAEAIYGQRCLDVPFSETKFCPVYHEHTENVRFLDQVGRVLEGLVYQNYGLLQGGDGTRISWYQLMGQLLKRGGQALPILDPYRSSTVTAGKAEKLIGQIENEFTMGCNSNILKPIQEIRNFCHTQVHVQYSSFIEDCNCIEELGNKLSTMNELSSEYYEIMNALKEKQTLLYELHVQLHRDVMFVYEEILKMKAYIPAMIEHQLEVNLYSTSYLEYVLFLFKENKTINKQSIALNKYKENIETYVPDFREVLHDASTEHEIIRKDMIPVSCNKYASSLPQRFDNAGIYQPIFTGETLRNEQIKKKKPLCGKTDVRTEKRQQITMPVRGEDVSDSYEEDKLKPKSKRNFFGNKSKKEHIQPKTDPDIYEEDRIIPKSKRNIFGMKSKKENIQPIENAPEITKKQKGCGKKKKDKEIISNGEDQINKRYTETNMSLTLQTSENQKSIPY